MKRAKIVVLVLVAVLASCSRDPKAQAQRYVDNGNKFFEKGKFKEASIMYRKALQKDLLFGEAYYRLGLTNLKLSDYGSAARALRRAVELQPTNTDAAAKLADLYLLAYTQNPRGGKEMLAEATELTDKLLKTDPKSFEALRLSGHVALLNKDPEGAIKAFKAANDVRPMRPELVVVLFQTLSNNKRDAEAEELGWKMVEAQKNFVPMYDFLYLHYARRKQLDQAEKVLLAKTGNNPKATEHLMQLARHYFLLSRRSEMDEVLKRATNTTDHPSGHLQAGEFFVRVREFDRARQQFEAGMAAFPKDKARYQKKMVEVLLLTGRAPEARQLIDTILKDNSKDVDGIAMRAAMMLQTGNREQIQMAINDYQSLVTKSPTNHLLRYNLARALVAKSEFEQARIHLEEAIKLRKDFVTARELLARLWLVKQDGGRALKETDEILALDRNHPQARLIKSTALMMLNEPDRARQELNSILAANPQNLEAQYQLGYLEYTGKDFGRAEAMFRKLYQTNPSDLRGLVGLVETAAAQRRFKEAIQMLQNALAKEPARTDLKVALANLQVRAEQYDSAIGLFGELVKQNPGSPDLLFKLAETYRRKGDLNSAIEHFRRASQAAPQDPNPLLQLGLLMDGTGKREEAKPIYEQILKIQPDHPVALNNLAYIKAEEGSDLDQALTMAQRARQRMPMDPNIADTLGWIYIKKNLSDEAVRIFKELVVQEPKNASFRYHFGMALLQKGDKPAARKEFQTALQNNPSVEEQGKIKDLLAKI